jgi:hypothetical protein
MRPKLSGALSGMLCSRPKGAADLAPAGTCTAGAGRGLGCRARSFLAALQLLTWCSSSAWITGLSQKGHGTSVMACFLAHAFMWIGSEAGKNIFPHRLHGTARRCMA